VTRPQHSEDGLTRPTRTACRYPGCPVGVAPYLEVHHLDHWLDGGHTDTDRMLCPCPYHHDRPHAGDYTMTGTPTSRDGVRITGSSGRKIRLATPHAPAAAQHHGPRYHESTGEDIDHNFFTINPNRGPSP
jgi:hypothetical protein